MMILDLSQTFEHRLRRTPDLRARSFLAKVHWNPKSQAMPAPEYADAGAFDVQKQFHIAVMNVV